MTQLRISISSSREQFDAFAARLAQELDADMVLSSPGYPAETTSVVGVHPEQELLFTEQTTPEAVKHFCFDTPGVALGYVSYTYGMLLRGIASDKPNNFPLGHLKKYRGWVEYNAEQGATVISAADQSMLDDLADRLNTALGSAPMLPVKGLPKGAPVVSLDQAGYEAGVSETLERILSGHTYQLNLSTKFSWNCPDLDPLALLLVLRRDHPAPFYAWMQSGQHRVLSTSPERFIRVSDGHVLSQPIKGTLRVDKHTPEAEAQLVNSPKERAELSMIVDLIRNDISANCEYGSVEVRNHLSVFAVDTLLQMYSDVHGKLRAGRDCLDLFFDAFPGGSITGCPKLSSMTIIEELEPHSRGLYCGSMVVIRDERNMDSSIAIRTAVHDTDSGAFDLYAGSGIVVDSDPAKEYQETMAKAEKFLTLGDA
ncbi:chorismate-binding protein [Pseudodesulfovibrio sp. zrk46]|uniref:chorismate-binding protein n=1 Tax=Pseudodesulfovibrio sp. zrk46 TaxID=2725288 RepID=UPI001448D4A7|nr:chorismate-binding protein [Pseudodesulfovibrio sp. zrk46]QJB55996.1 chorismate-binding protein [Pseudodesulfovibrio sp. zrk46]